MKNNPTVSVLLPVYNCERFISATIESLFSQTFTDFEIIAIDDGSIDLSFRILYEFSKKDNRLKVIKNVHQGIVKTLNAALKNASGKYCARMDADDTCHPERLRLLVNHLDQNETVVVVGTQGYLIDINGLPIKPLTVKTKNSAIQESLLYTRNRDGIIHASTMFRRESALKIGGYRKKYEFAEDLDFFLRLGEFGLIENINACLYYYRQHMHTISRTRAALQYNNANLAILDACERRGISMLAGPVKSESDFQNKNNEFDLLYQIVLGALNNGHKKTAVINSLAIVLKHPLNKVGWKLVFKSIIPNQIKDFINFFVK